MGPSANGLNLVITDMVRTPGMLLRCGCNHHSGFCRAMTLGPCRGSQAARDVSVAVLHAEAGIAPFVQEGIIMPGSCISPVFVCGEASRQSAIHFFHNLAYCCSTACTYFSKHSRFVHCVHNLHAAFFASADAFEAIGRMRWWRHDTA